MLRYAELSDAFLLIQYEIAYGISAPVEEMFMDCSADTEAPGRMEPVLVVFGVITVLAAIFFWRKETIDEGAWTTWVSNYHGKSAYFNSDAVRHNAAKSAMRADAIIRKHTLDK